MIETYRDLLNELLKLTPEQLKQKAQFAPYSADGDALLTLQPIIGLGTVAEMDQPTRSSYDNDHHPEDVVLWVDGNGFGVDGCCAWQLDGDQVGEPGWLEKAVPIYPTKRVDWTSGEPVRSISIRN